MTREGQGRHVRGEGFRHAHCQVSEAPLWRRLLWDGGGTPMDVFLTAASAQVGQVILNLPSE